MSDHIDMIAGDGFNQCMAVANQSAGNGAKRFLGDGLGLGLLLLLDGCASNTAAENFAAASNIVSVIVMEGGSVAYMEAANGQTDEASVADASRGDAVSFTGH